MARYRKRLEEFEAYQFFAEEWEKGGFHKGGGRVLDNVFYDKKTGKYRLDVGNDKSIPIEDGQFVVLDDRGKVRLFEEEAIKYKYERIG